MRWSENDLCGRRALRSRCLPRARGDAMSTSRGCLFRTSLGGVALSPEFQQVQKAHGAHSESRSWGAAHARQFPSGRSARFSFPLARESRELICCVWNSGLRRLEEATHTHTHCHTGKLQWVGLDFYALTDAPGVQLDFYTGVTFLTHGLLMTLTIDE